MANQTAKPAEGKLGIMVVGLGAVTSTFMTGVLMVRKGLSKPVGSMIEYDRIRVGKGNDKKYLSYREVVPITELKDIVFGAWDVYPADAYRSAMYAEVLKEKDIEPVKDELETIVPMKAAFDKNFAKRLDGDNVMVVRLAGRWWNNCVTTSARSKRRTAVRVSWWHGLHRPKSMCLISNQFTARSLPSRLR